MCVFGICENWQSAFLAQKRRRKSEGVPIWGFYRALFEYFKPVFAKSRSFFTKIERFSAVFTAFEKDTRVIARNRKIRTYNRNSATNFTKKWTTDTHRFLERRSEFIRVNQWFNDSKSWKLTACNIRDRYRKDGRWGMKTGWILTPRFSEVKQGTYTYS